MKVAFGTVIFPNNILYIKDFLDSLDKQTEKNFTLVIVNDGVKDAKKYLSKYYNNNYVLIEPGNSAQANRHILIEYIANNFDITILGDSDDLFSSNRIEKSLENLNKYDLVVNDLIPFNSLNKRESSFFYQRLNNKDEVSFMDVLNKNFFGMSNTAFINSNAIGILEKINYKTDIFDWHFFLNFLLSTDKAIFINEAHTKYRLHEKNLVGVKTSIQRINVKNKIIKKIIAPKKLYNEYLKQVYLSTFNNKKIWWE